MNPERTLNGTFWLMIAVQTIGGIDVGTRGVPGIRKLPAPRVYVAAMVLWALLGLVADMAPRLGKAAAGLSGLVVLAAMVLGPFGKKLTGFLDTVAKSFAGKSIQTEAQQTGLGLTAAGQQLAAGAGGTALGTGAAPPKRPRATKAAPNLSTLGL